MSARLIAMVGPSGVGKDTVMAAMVAATPRLRLVRRVITRPAAAGGEDFDAVDTARFEAMAQAGAFALHWGAHGLHYGIPVGVDDDLAGGHDMLANLSRGVLVAARARFAGMIVISLTAAPQVLAQRLAARGRETSGDIARRLARAADGLPDGIDAIEIDNSGALSRTVNAALAALYPVSV